MSMAQISVSNIMNRKSMKPENIVLPLVNESSEYRKQKNDKKVVNWNISNILEK